MRLVKQLLLSAIVCGLVVSGCGRKAKNDSGNGGGPDNPENPELNLSGEDQAKFNAWKASLSKTCSAAEIFSGSEEDAVPQIDGRVLLQKLGSSLAVKIDDNNTVWLGNSSSQSGTSETKYQTETTVNGAGRVLKASTKRSGSDCEVYLFDKLVFKTTVYSQVAIVGASGGSLQDIKPVDADLMITRSSDGSRASIQAMNSFARLMIAATKPSEASQKQLAAKLGVSEAQAKAWFPLGRTDFGALPFNAVVADSDLAPFDFGSAALAGSNASVEALYNKTTWKLRFHVLSPKMKAQDVENTNDKGLWVIEAQYNVANVASTTPAPKKTIQIASVKDQGILNSDNGAAASCFVTRLIDLKILAGLAADASLKSSANEWFPAANAVLPPCDLRAENMSEAIIGNGDALKTWQKVYENLSGSNAVSLRGWDQILREMVKLTYKKGQDINAVLNANGTLPLVSQAKTHIDSLEKSVKSREKLKALVEDIPVAALHWSLTGQNVTAAQVEDLAVAVENTIDPFYDAAVRLFNNAMYDMAREQENIAYAKSVSAEYKAAGRDAWARAKAAGADDVLVTEFKEILTKRTPQSTFEAWKTTLDAYGAFKGREAQRLGNEQGLASTRHNSGVAKVAAMALKNFWAAGDFEALEKIGMYAIAVDSSCSLYKTASGVADGCQSSALSSEPGKMLAKEYQGRYGNLAVEFGQYHKQLDDEYSLQVDLKREFFDPIWAKCDNTKFGEKAGALRSLVPAYLSAEFSQKYEIKRQISDVLQDCR